MTSRSPFKDLSSCQKCCQWAALNQQPFWGPHTCNDPSCGCIKTRPWVMSGNPEGPPSSRAPTGSAQVIWAASQLDFSLCPVLFLPSWFHKCWPQDTPNTHPDTRLHLGLNSTEPTCIQKKKKKKDSSVPDFYLKIISYSHTYNFKNPQREYKIAETGLWEWTRLALV